jgi:aspartate kinase
MLIQKFGGTSMGDPGTIHNNVVPIIRSALTNNERPVVVVSAMTGITNELLGLAQGALSKDSGEPSIQPGLERIRQRHIAWIESFGEETVWFKSARAFLDSELLRLEQVLSAIAIIGELPVRSHDAVLAIGEKLSAHTLSCALNATGVPAEYIDTENIIPHSLKYRSDDYWDEVAKLFKSRLSSVPVASVPVLPGYFGQIDGGILAAVGRGYSDFSASLVGRALEAREVQIWTDVDGVLSANPRIVSDAQIIPRLSFDEMAELAHFGAKVLHPFSVRPAVQANIPIRILNTFNSTCPGTVVETHSTAVEHPCKSVTYKKGVTIIRITTPRMLLAHGFLAQVGSVFEQHRVSVDLIATSEISISLTVDQALEDDNALVDDLTALGEVDLQRDNAIISVIGDKIAEDYTFSAMILSELGAARIAVKLISLGNSLINFSIVVDNAQCERAVQLLHARLHPHR